MKSLGTLACVAVLAAPAAASPCGTDENGTQNVCFGYEGSLSKDGSPATDPVSLTFKLYDDEEGVSEVWTETHADVALTNGAFSVVVGSEFPLPGDTFAADDLWLGVTIGSSSELRPLQPILWTARAAWASRANYADGAAYAETAGNADAATWADAAGNATFADKAALATNAANAVSADNAANAAFADNAGYADNAGLLGSKGPEAFVSGVKVSGTTVTPQGGALELVAGGQIQLATDVAAGRITITNTSSVDDSRCDQDSAGCLSLYIGYDATLRPNNVLLAGSPWGNGAANQSLYWGNQKLLLGALASDGEHGALSGGNLHAAASAVTAGFMAAADKSKLDGIAAAATNTPLGSSTPAALTPGITATAGSSTSAARADHVHPVTIPYKDFTANAESDAPNTGDPDYDNWEIAAAITNMTAGTYLVLFTAAVKLDTNTIVSVGIGSNTAMTPSADLQFQGVNQNAYKNPITLHKVHVVSSNGESIALWWSKNGTGIARMRERRLTAIRLH